MFKVGKNVVLDAEHRLEFRGANDAGEELRIGSIVGEIRSNTKGSDKSKVSVIVRQDGNHKAVLTVQDDGVLLHIDTPLVLQNTGWKKTFVTGTATGRRKINFPDQSGEVIVNESGKVMAADLPTSDPSNAGQLWNDSGTVKISAG
jgi:hypothetical protein